MRVQTNQSNILFDGVVVRGDGCRYWLADQCLLSGFWQEANFLQIVLLLERLFGHVVVERFWARCFLYKRGQR